jgi:uncharacterized membrane protein
MSNTNAELQKEFELERMILFSDAVFAIAITLLIIEIKFPEIEKGASPQQVFLLFKPVIVEFLAFIVSFFFIGITWARHLRICKYLSAYDNGVIARNLLLLFFVVCFPFSASGLARVRPSVLFLPFFIYFTNISALMLSHFALCYYIFRQKPALSVHGFEAEKKFLVMQSKYTAILLAAGLCIMLVVTFMFPDNKKYVLYSVYPIALGLIIYRKYLQRYKKKMAIKF